MLPFHQEHVDPSELRLGRWQVNYYLFSAVALFLGERLTAVEVSFQTAGCLVGRPANGERMPRETKIEGGRQNRLEGTSQVCPDKT